MALAHTRPLTLTRCRTKCDPDGSSGCGHCLSILSDSSQACFVAQSCASTPRRPPHELATLLGAFATSRSDTVSTWMLCGRRERMALVLSVRVTITTSPMSLPVPAAWTSARMRHVSVDQSEDLTGLGRKKKGLESLGYVAASDLLDTDRPSDVVKLAAQAGVSVVAFVKKFDEDAPKLRPDTSAIVSLSDSELSELEDSDVKPKVKTVTSKKAATPKKAVKDTTKGKKKAEAKDAKGKKAVKGKDAKGKETKGKATAKDVKSKTGAKGKAVKPKVEKKQPPPMPEPILYPPAIETVPTRHSKGEIEQRAFVSSSRRGHD